jgi:hypothetical protein
LKFFSKLGLTASLRTGSVALFKPVPSTEKQTFPPGAQSLASNALPGDFKAYLTQKYGEGIWWGD